MSCVYLSYAYAVARLRAMENRFLDMQFFSRLIESATLEEAFKSLSDTVYAQWISASSESGFDKVIDSELIASCQDLSKFVPDKELLDICRMPHDFHNVKVILKSLFKSRENGERRYDLLSKLGAFDAESLVMAMESAENAESAESEGYGTLPYGLEKVIPHCFALWERTKNPQQVEAVIDAHLFASMKATAEKLDKKLKTSSLTSWVERKIDAENLRNAVRLQRMSFDRAGALPFLHEGGTISRENVVTLMEEPLASWSKSISHSDVSAALETFQDKTDTQASLYEVSKALDAYLIRVLDATKYSPFAPENVLLYILRKEEEARNLRIALVCVANGLNREFARRLLSHG